MTTVVRSLVAVLALAIAAGACASHATEASSTSPTEGLIDDLRDAVDPDQDAQLDAVLSQFEDLGIGGLSDGMTSEQTRCFNRSVDAEDLDYAALLTDPEAEESRKRLIEILFECVPNISEIEGIGAAFARQIEQVAGGSFQATQAEGACVVQYVLDNSSDPARTLIVADTEEDVLLVLDALEICLTPDQFAAFVGGPQSYGDDDRWDRMYDECTAGDDRVCDLLYLTSAAGSEYEALSLDCAGRGLLDSTFCSPDVEIDGTGFAPLDSPGLLVLSEDCLAGDNTACDLLYQLAPIGSEYEDVGFSCGGRMAIGALPDCRTRLG